MLSYQLVNQFVDSNRLKMRLLMNDPLLNWILQILYKTIEQMILFQRLMILSFNPIVPDVILERGLNFVPCFGDSG